MISKTIRSLKIVLELSKLCLHISVDIYKDIFSFVNCFQNVLLLVLTQSLSYWLYLLLFYYLVFDLKANGINVIDEQGATGGAL